MSSPTQRYSPLPPMPTHSDEDQFDYHYILEIDLTVDPPIYNWKLTSKSKKRRVLGDLSKQEASTRRQRRTMMRPVIGENRGINLQNERSYTRPPDRNQLDLTEGIGLKQTQKRSSGNAWINHLKAFAKKHNMSYREALRSGEARQSYIKGGTNIFNPIDGFKVGYKFGDDTLGPALFGKK